ncbi:MAG: tRNA uridine-5-carboxymethylaminomethyl(34) synthesis GTPase MnmE [Lentisphaerales bacterium]|nr:MAG: tRNA uridine-5-carboxymethylaminomethyl(34) synthesis GTPase MnmE [Lentisphaerales bacterium]
MCQRMDSASDTIAAIATAPGCGAIAIVRISGPQTLQIADRIFSCPAQPPSARPGNTFVLGFAHTPALDGSSGDLIDESLILIFRAPHSYTRSDLVEIQCHGGTTSARRILAAAVDAGARPAEPGEFTKLAFLSGRIDLPRAEAVLDLVRAQSDRASASALAQLRGGISRSLTTLSDLLVSTIANLELALDFPDDEYAGPPIEAAISSLELAVKQSSDLLSTAGEGQLLRQGALVVISGPPNAGKSTLFNCLLANERSITDHEPGTTRDTIEETWILNGIPIHLVDTAGLNGSATGPEADGVRRARSMIRRADYHLHVLDASQSLPAASLADLHMLPKTESLVILNKADLGTALTSSDIAPFASICASLLRSEGLDIVRQSLSTALAQAPSTEDVAHVSQRHAAALRRARDLLAQAHDLLAQHSPENQVLAASNIYRAISHIDALTGKHCSEEVLATIFASFCIGK